MEPFEGTPAPGEPAPIPEPALDDPPAMDASEAFSAGRAIGNGWYALKRAPIPMFLAGLIMFVLDQGLGGGNSGGGRNRRDDDYGSRDYDYFTELADSVGHPFRLGVSDLFGDVFEPIGRWAQVDPDVAALAALSLGAMLCALVLIVLFTIAKAFMRPGVIRLHSHILQTAENMSLGVMFSGSDRFVHMLLWELLVFAIVWGILTVAFIPVGAGFAVGIAAETPALIFVGLAIAFLLLVTVGIYVMLGISLGAHAVTLERRGPIDALKRSWHLVRGNRWNLFVFFFIQGLFTLAAAIVGVLACCVGALVTMPGARAITDFGLTESFLMYTRGRGVTDYWKLWEQQFESP